MENYDIDFVIPWVDGNDPVWRNDKEQYWVAEGNTPYKDGNQPARFRDWNNLQYWFRSVEKFAPWVNHIYFVTCGHVPAWLNTNHPKLTIVKHEDFIPKEYLPVFQANPIEINFHRIRGLSEHFVYFNDDMFITSPVTKEDFFVGGKPREMAAMYLLTNNGANDTFQYMLFRMMGEVNKHFDFHSSVKKNWRKWYNIKYKKYLLNNLLLYRFNNVSGLMIPHVPSSMTISNMKEVWDVLEDAMRETCGHKFRNARDITQYIFRYWAIMKGEFEPANIFEYGGEYFVVDRNIDDLINTIKNQGKKFICINDSVELNDFEYVSNSINNAFATVLVEKSSYEK